MEKSSLLTDKLLFNKKVWYLRKLFCYLLFFEGMAVHHLYCRQVLDTDINTAWDFFSQPGNLKKITPEFMGFDILSVSGPEKLHAGQIINYIVKPFAGIPLNWVTEITHVKKPFFFVDEQRLGPFFFWHHKHYLETHESGQVVMIDSVHYKVFYGLMGNLLNRWIVKNRLDHIFDYRVAVIQKMFGQKPVDQVI